MEIICHFWSIVSHLILLWKLLSKGSFSGLFHVKQMLLIGIHSSSLQYLLVSLSCFGAHDLHRVFSTDFVNPLLSIKYSHSHVKWVNSLNHRTAQTQNICLKDKIKKLNDNTAFKLHKTEACTRGLCCICYDTLNIKHIQSHRDVAFWFVDFGCTRC